jgi:hypothetical protein
MSPEALLLAAGWTHAPRLGWWREALVLSDRSGDLRNFNNGEESSEKKDHEQRDPELFLHTWVTFVRIGTEVVYPCVGRVVHGRRTEGWV